jgi:restriction endonuclease S subunit
MKILDIAEVKMGYGFRSRIVNKPGGNIAVIQPRDISDSGLLQVRDVFRIDMNPVKPDKLLKKGDVLLGSRARFVSSVYHNQLDSACIASGSLLILTLKDDIPVLPEYLALYLNSSRGNAELNRLTERTTIPYLNQSSLEQLDIPVPPLEQQEKLIAFERTKQHYAELTARKIELISTLINHHLSDAASAESELSTPN